MVLEVPSNKSHFSAQDRTYASGNNRSPREDSRIGCGVTQNKQTGADSFGEAGWSQELSAACSEGHLCISWEAKGLSCREELGEAA